MSEAEQLQLFYSIEEVDAKVNEAVTNAAAAYESAYSTNSAHNQRIGAHRVLESLLEVLKDTLSGSMVSEDNETFTEIYNAVALSVGAPTITSVATKTWNVTVYAYGDVVGTVEVEADDEASAIALVEENTEVRDVTLSIEVDINGERFNEDVNPYHASLNDMVNDELTFEAEEA